MSKQKQIIKSLKNIKRLL